MGNPVLFVKDAGFGATPLPPDALLKPGDTLNIIDERTGKEKLATVVAVAPAGVPMEYALADQAQPPIPRPLMIAEPRDCTAYAIELPHGKTVIVTQATMLKGLTAACPDCLGTGRGSATDPEAKCETCGGRGRRDVRGADGVKP